MAEQVRLVEYDTWLGTRTYFNIFDGSEGIYIARGGWTQKTARQDEAGNWQNVNEAITLQVKGTSNDNLAARTQALEGWVRRVRSYLRKKQVTKRYYLQAQMRAETDPRYTRVRWIELSQGAALHQPPAATDSFIAEYTLVIERAPFWRSWGSDGAALEAQGDLGQFSYSEGSENAIIHVLTVQESTGGPFTEVWFGLRTDELGDDKDNYDLDWDAEDASSTGDDTSLVAGSPGYAQVDFTGGGTETLVHRFTILTQDVYTALTASPFDARGEFTVLARAAVTDAGLSARIRMRDGYATGGIWTYHPRVDVPASGVSTNWFLYPLGEIAIPPSRWDVPNVTGYASLRSYGIRIDAELVSGSGYLRIDKLYLIPTAEGGGYLKGESSSGSVYYVHTDEFGETESLQYASSNTVTVPVFQARNWRVPAGYGNNGIRGFGVCQRSNQHATTDVMVVTLVWHPAWLTLRGNQFTGA